MVALPGMPRGGHHGPARGRVVGRLGPGDALDGALAEPGLVARPALGLGVADHGRHRAPFSRQHAHERADPARAQDRRPHLAEVRPGGQLDRRQGHALEHHVQAGGLGQQLAHGEHPDHHRDEVDALHQLGHVEREALHARGEVDADGRHQHPEGAPDQVLGRRLPADRGQHGQPEQRQREVLRRPEVVRQTRQQRRRHDQHDQAEHPSDRARHHRHPQRTPRLALLRQREAVQGGGQRRGRPGRVDQDRRDRPPERPRAVQRRQQRDGVGGAHADGERHQQRGGHGGAQPRQGPHQHPDDRAHQDDGQRDRIGQNAYSGQESIHDALWLAG